jgi:hypothetical protein
MTLREDMRSALQEIPGFLGESWEFRQMTSGPAVAMSARTYGSWTAVTAHVTGRSNLEQYDDNRGDKRVEVGVFRVSDASTVLHQGDQVRDTTTTVNNPNLWWAVMGVKSSGIGTIAYMIQRDIVLKGGPNRNGGV